LAGGEEVVFEGRLHARHLRTEVDVLGEISVDDQTFALDRHRAEGDAPREPVGEPVLQLRDGVERLIVADSLTDTGRDLLVQLPGLLGQRFGPTNVPEEIFVGSHVAHGYRRGDDEEQHHRTDRSGHVTS
jgi:hypothetical protein